MEDLEQIVALALGVLNPSGEQLPCALDQHDDPAGSRAEATIETTLPAPRHIGTTGAD